MRSQRYRLHGLEVAVQRWGDAAGTPVVMLHGWMDCGGTFAPVARGLAPRTVFAPDWRGFGASDPTPGHTYWIPDYLADLDALLARIAPDRPADLVGHSLGGNVAGLYAGVRPERIRRLVVIEGFGLPEREPGEAPGRYAEWLDSLQAPPTPRIYADIGGLARRIAQRHPGISDARAREVAELWSDADAGGSGRRLRADPAHWRPTPTLYRVDEALACWRRIRAPVLWLYGGQSAYARRMREAADWPRRCAAIGNLQLACIPEAGHAPHLSHPEQLAARLRRFLDA